jgi:hypothetical protein
MKLSLSGRRFILGMTLVETSVALGIGTAILGAFITASVALQRSFVAIEDYAKGQNDQMRISDYLALDMRRAFTINVTGDSTHPPVTVTLTIPNFYVSPDTPYPPRIVSWPGQTYPPHNKHQGVLINQKIDYGTVVTPTLTVSYAFDNGSGTISRSVNDGINPPTTSVIATDVNDFSVTTNLLDQSAQTQITFKPRFKTLASAAAITATTYFQTTLTRNTRD